MKTVNFIEAVNSGKRFRSTGKYLNDCWLDLDENYLRMGGVTNIEISKNLINSQFVLEENSVTITESDLDKILGTGLGLYLSKAELKKQLGFTNE